MRRLRRWTLRLAAGLAVLLLAALGLLAAALWHSLPGGSHSATIAGLAQGASVELDDDAIPRIRATTMRDAAAVLGYLHARERMFQMDMMRRAAAGELSEIVGPATLPHDRLMRTLGLARSAQRDAAGLHADTRAMLDAYAAGVNAWISARGRFAAAEFILLGAPRPWTAADSLLWTKTMGLYLSANWRTELARAQGHPAPWPPTVATAAPHAASPKSCRPSPPPSPCRPAPATPGRSMHAIPPPAPRCSPATRISASPCPASGTSPASTRQRAPWPAPPPPACPSW